MHVPHLYCASFVRPVALRRCVRVRNLQLCLLRITNMVGTKFLGEPLLINYCIKYEVLLNICMVDRWK